MLLRNKILSQYVDCDDWAANIIERSRPDLLKLSVVAHARAYAFWRIGTTHRNFSSFLQVNSQKFCKRKPVKLMEGDDRAGNLPRVAHHPECLKLINCNS